MALNIFCCVYIYIYHYSVLDITCMVCYGKAWYGMVRHGMAWNDMAGMGIGMA